MAYISLGNIKAKTSNPRLRFWAVIIVGSAIISAWTLIWFFSRPANFDQAGQLVLAHQWLNGQHTGSVVGPTNYILKILLLYMPADLIPISSQLKLIFITLLINISTFILSIIGLSKIWKHFNHGPGKIVYSPFLYLSFISGSVFWMSFANSRNLEVASGIFLIYLFLTAQVQPTRLRYALLILLSSLLFFADPLQIYMSTLPAVVFTGLVGLKNGRRKLSKYMNLLLCAMIGIVIAKLITLLVKHIWNVSFIASSRPTGFHLSSVKQAAEQMARLYAGGHEIGRAVQALNLLVVLAVITSSAWIAWRKKQYRPVLFLFFIFWAIDLAVYVLSGQAVQPDTSRYLIMTVPAFILAAVAVLSYFKSSKILPYVVAVILSINVLGITRAFTSAWDPSLSINAHDRSTISYFKAHRFTYGYASINTALAGSYFSNSKINILPLGCDPGHILKKANLFFDKSQFQLNEKPSQTALVPLILDGESITISPTTCEPNQIAKQLGPWQSTDRLSDGSTILLYPAGQFQRLRGF